MENIYLKVRKDICPNCKEEREIIVQGVYNRKGKEFPKFIIGFKCSNCKEIKKVEILQTIN